MAKLPLAAWPVLRAYRSPHLARYVARVYRHDVHVVTHPTANPPWTYLIDRRRHRSQLRLTITLATNPDATLICLVTTQIEWWITNPQLLLATGPTNATGVLRAEIAAGLRTTTAPGFDCILAYRRHTETHLTRRHHTTITGIRWKMLTIRVNQHRATPLNWRHNIDRWLHKELSTAQQSTSTPKRAHP